MDNAQENEAHNLMIAARMNYENALRNETLASECVKASRRNLLITIGNVAFAIANFIVAILNYRMTAGHH